jgi:hypothetical protein
MMRTIELRLQVRGVLTVLLGLLALAGTPLRTVRADDGGATELCSTNCDYSFGKHSCAAGSTCTAESCVGVNGVVYPYYVYCAAAQ